MDDWLNVANLYDINFLYFDAFSFFLMAFRPLGVFSCVTSFGGVDNHLSFTALLYTL